jgi:hypothetical protein
MLPCMCLLQAVLLPMMKSACCFRLRGRMSHFWHGVSELRARLELSTSESSEQVSASMMLWDAAGQPAIGCLKLRRAASKELLEQYRQTPAPALLYMQGGRELRSKAVGSPAISDRLTGLLENEHLAALRVLVQEEIATIVALPNASLVSGDALSASLSWIR